MARGTPQFSKTDLRRGLLTAPARPPEPIQASREIATGKLEQALLFGEEDPVQIHPRRDQGAESP